MATQIHPLFVADTYKGIPVDAVTASIIRDQEREAAQKKAGLTKDDVWQATQKSFEPAITAVKGAPMAISKETEGRLQQIADAPSLASALDLVKEMPEVAAIAKANSNGAPVVQRVKELQSWQMAGAMVGSGSVRHYANHVRLMAFDRQGEGPELRLQVVRHFAGNADFGSLWVHQTEMAFDKAYSDHWYAFGSAGASKVNELFPNLTPKGLSDALRATLSTGKPPASC
jgi:hypothetical protein